MTDDELSAIRQRYQPSLLLDLFNATTGPTADFIAHVDRDVPSLLAEVDRLRAENDELRKALRTYERVQLASRMRAEQ